MLIKHDYSYISNTQNKLLQDGLAEINIHSLNTVEVEAEDADQDWGSVYDKVENV